MDGEAVRAAFAATPGPDCLKDVVTKTGPRLRVYKAFQELIKVNLQLSTENDFHMTL